MDPIHVLAEGLTNNLIDWVYVRGEKCCPTCNY